MTPIAGALPCSSRSVPNNVRSHEQNRGHAGAARDLLAVGRVVRLLAAVPVLGRQIRRAAKGMGPWTLPARPHDRAGAVVRRPRLDRRAVQAMDDGRAHRMDSVRIDGALLCLRLVASW